MILVRFSVALKNQETIFKHFLVEIMNSLLGKIYKNSKELIMMPAEKNNSMFLFISGAI